MIKNMNSVQIDQETIDTIASQIRKGQKIAAIKSLRAAAALDNNQRSTMGLKEAKNVLDIYMPPGTDQNSEQKRQAAKLWSIQAQEHLSPAEKEKAHVSQIEPAILIMAKAWNFNVHISDDVAHIKHESPTVDFYWKGSKDVKGFAKDVAEYFMAVGNQSLTASLEYDFS